MLVTFTGAGLALLDLNTDGQIDVELTSEADVLSALNAGLITVEHSGVYFECPLLRHRGN
jgi:hypothetical protein